jgi:tryptophan aminotransferase
VAYRLLDSWGYDGFKTHTDRVAQFYKGKRDVFQSAMKKYLDGYAEWVPPEAGMFFWYVNVNPFTDRRYFLTLGYLSIGSS